MNNDAESNFHGRWEMISSENYGDFLKVMGVGMIQRSLAEKTRPTLEITHAAGVWTITKLIPLKNTEISFVPGEEFFEELEDGRNATCIVTLEGDNKMTHEQKIDEETFTIVSAVSPSEMTQTYTAEGVTATRIFKKL